MHSQVAPERSWTIAELLLRRWCVPPRQGHGSHAFGEELADDPLAILRREYPDLVDLVAGKRVVDFGCGMGRQATTLVRDYGCEAAGIDNHPGTLARARALAQQQGLGEDQVLFVDRPTPAMLGSYDVVISQNAMEHFADPALIVNEMKRLLRPGGVLLVTFGPPWYAPYGAHMSYFCKLPWVQLFFSESTIMRVRSLYRQDGARRYRDIESGLNQISLRGFERIVAAAGLRIERVRYTGVKGLQWPTRVPVLRELFVNHVTTVLRLPG